MLYTGLPNHFNWQVNNFSDTFPGNAAGTTLTADGSSHTKGSDTAVLTGIAHDAYAMAITVNVGNTDTVIRRQMIDLLIDPAAGVGNAGSSWSTLINNLYCNSPSLNANGFGFRFHFPLYIKAGTAIGARVQDVVGGATCRFSIQLFGKPTRPDLLHVGNVVETLGATTASTSGVAVTPGNASWGSYSASLGQLTRPAWFWQLGLGSSDTTMGATAYWWDIAEDATSKYTCASMITYSTSGSETAVKTEFGQYYPVHAAAAGQDVYVRGYSNGVPDTNFTAVVYAVS